MESVGIKRHAVLNKNEGTYPKKPPKKQTHDFDFSIASSETNSDFTLKIHRNQTLHIHVISSMKNTSIRLNSV